jgi:iron complex outermembrane receptor protein
MTKRDWRAERRNISAVLWLSGVMGAAQAAPGASVSEEEYLGEMPVVLSVSRLSQPVSEAPSAVTVIDREMIRTSGAREIPDLLRFVPGFYTGFYLGNEPVISRAVTARYYGRIQVLVDGRSVYTPLFGQVPWTSIPLQIDDIERIEVTRGPNSASYGANSFLSVINIITRHAQEDRGAAAMVRAGDDGIADGMVRYGGRTGDLDYRLTVGYQADHGLPDLHDFKRIGMLSGRGDYRLNQTDALQVQVGYSDGRQGKGWADEELNPPHTQYVTDSFAQIKWQRVSGIDDETSVQFYYTRSASRESATTLPYGLALSTLLTLNTTAERYDLEFQRNQAWGAALRLSWGASARLDRVHAPLYLSSESVFDTDLYRLFGNLEWRATPSLLVHVGAMGERNSITGGEISPRGAMSYHFASGQTVRVGISKAQRTPTILENDGKYYLNLPISGSGMVAFPYYLGPGNLHAEHILSREIAYIGEWPRLGLGIDVRLYREQLTDVIDVTRYIQHFNLGPGGVVPFDQKYYVYGNLAGVETNGIETQIGWRGQNSRLWLTHAYRRTTSPNELYVNATPNHVYGLLASHKFPGRIEASASFYHVDQMEAIGDSTGLPGHNRVDLRLAKGIKIGGVLSEIALIGQNITGRYLDYNDHNKIDQRLFMTLRTGF